MGFTSDIKTHSDFNQLMTWFLSEKSLYVEKKEYWNISLFAKNISNLYQNLPVIINDLKQSSIPVKLLSDDNLKERDDEYLEPIIRLKKYVHKHLREYIVDFLIHGSIATLDYSKGWSDLDTLVIVNNQTLQDYDKLVDFRSKVIECYGFLLEIDPHQHHGFIFCTEKSLSQYFSHYLPLEVLFQSKSLLGDSEIKLHHKRRTEDAFHSFSNKNLILHSAYLNKELRHHSYQNNYLSENFKNLDAMYQLKYFLSIIMTLPTYYLDAKGAPCYKKDSFEIVRNEFEEYWEIIDKASLIRLKWPNNEDHPYIGNLIPNWVVDTLGSEYFFRAYKLSNAMLNSLKN